MPVRYFPALFVVLWATGFIGARYAMPYMEPFLFLTARFLIAGAILGVWVVLAGNHWPSKRGAMHAIIAGCLIHGVYLGAVFWAIHNGLPAGMSALVVGLQPLITALIAGLALGEKIQPRHWAGLAVGFYGVAMVLWPKLSISADGITPATVSASILSVIAISAGTVWQKRFVGAIDLKAGTTLQYLGAAVLTGVFSLLFETHVVIWSGSLVFAMLWLVFVLSIGAVLLLMILINQGAVSKVASLFYLVPGVTALMAYALFGETLTLFQLFGMLIATLGVALSTGQRRSAALPSR
ncbi:EamA family transporter [Phyllobacterium brassicacearum]|uniref:EamA family transporter n=1 Tax=Phyllobacterium brassicacearum TaxID=314235 RepID=A0A2P7BRU0_9HYPH|nr:DMT family transporter [Phyllobacterium brassicacearum]PSH69193.1 EamA family transporter [Phyllobacterium brassicacearum]TDQ22580.1 EamA-like transporter family protein [Phyllobacterium brassicacearum]